MANKVDVFTEELSKVFTILQQQYVMIKYMKALITSGELDETEINKLKEQITLINTNIDTMMNDQIMPIKQNIERIEQGMSILNNAIENVSGRKLYRHDLKISHSRTSYDDNQYDIFLTYYSSNNLVTDTPEKLTTLTTAIDDTKLRSPVYVITSAGSSDYDNISLYYIGAVYKGSTWNIMNSNGSSSGIEINRVSDTVTPINW